MNDYLEGVKAKLTVTPFLTEAKPDDQTTLRVPFGSTVATTPPVTAPTFVSTVSMNPAARPLVLRKPLILKNVGHILIPNYRVSKGKSVCTNLNRIRVAWKVQGQTKAISTFTENKRN